MNPDKITPEHISTLALHEVFVFGSNEAGRHGRGAALQAHKYFEQHTIQAEGLRAGATPSRPKNKALLPRPLKDIALDITLFVRYAAERPQLRFLVTRIGCGLARYTDKDIAPLFFAAGAQHENIALPQSFLGLQSDSQKYTMKLLLAGLTQLAATLGLRSKASESPKVLDSQAPKIKAAPSPIVLNSLLRRSIKDKPLTGPEIKAARTASRTLPTRRRYLMWLRKQDTPVHVGKKQLARMAS